MSRKNGAYAVSPAKKMRAPASRQHESTPEGAVSIERTPRGEMLRRRQRDRQGGGLRFLPPIKLLDPANAGRPHERSVSQRRHHERIEAFREHAERPQIAVIVVVVTEQHRRDGRQVVERDGRLPDSPRSEQVQRTCTLGIHRVGQDVPCRRLNQKRRVTDERDDGAGAVECRRPSRRLVDVRRPGCSRLEQHPRNGREWLAGGAGGIDESPSIKVIALCQVIGSGARADACEDRRARMGR